MKRCDGHVTNFKFKQNSFRVHVITYIVLPSSPFLSTDVKFIFYYPVLPASPGRGTPSIMSGFSILVQPTKPASLIRFLCEQ